ncbi:FxsA family protein [Aurantimonas sp. VKM B-3413]|uniref:FxsA family protein n=1 Tax=Aurantimonas sp. VKM B-3413 TaxID=2779401 RepID=UPI001E2F6FE5|nr:FxsA family protein [Aurantimonas sp. VKM B-3413]MCB8840588.1 membrane protein FxsA [Aurantimonas sp. VKM B-3413]
MPFALIPFALLVIPVLEIAVFILVGNLIGLWATLGLVILTAAIGSILLRRQGLGTLRRIQSEINAGRMPGRELVDGVMIAVAGVLLLTPGLVTDTIGFLLFVPGIREAIWSQLKRRAVVVGTSGFRAASQQGETPRDPRRRPAGPDVVDLSGEDYHRHPDPNSPWHAGDDRPDNPGNRTLH